MGPVAHLSLPPRSAAPMLSIVPASAVQLRRGEYVIADIARELKLYTSVRTIIDTLRALARHDGMPLPRNPRIVNGKPIHGPRCICAASRWDAGEFDAWIEGRGPTAPAPALPTPIREEMRLRAAAIGEAA